MAIEEFLNQHRALGQVVRGVGNCCIAVVGDQHTFTSCKAVGLDDEGGAVVIKSGLCIQQRGDLDGTTGGNARLIHDALGKRLGTLERSSSLVRSKDGNTHLAQRVCNTGNQRSFGADDNQINV